MGARWIGFARSMRGGRPFAFILLCFMPYCIPAYADDGVRWEFRAGRAVILPGASPEAPSPDPAIACLSGSPRRLYFEIDAKNFKVGGRISVSFHIDGIEFHISSHIPYRPAELTPNGVVPTPAMAEQESARFIKAMFNAKHVAWAIDGGRQRPLTTKYLGATMRKLAMHCSHESLDDKPTWSFWLSHGFGHAAVMPHDRPTDAYQSPIISCRFADKLSLYLELNSIRPSENVVAGASILVLFFADGVEFQFVGKAEHRIGEFPGAGLITSPTLAGPQARRFLDAMLAANRVSWSVNRGKRWILPTRNRSSAVGKLAANCGFPPSPVIAAQRALIWTGFLDQTPSGQIDHATQKAISAWQANHGIVPTGILSSSHAARLVAEGRAVEAGLGLKAYSDPNGNFRLVYPASHFAPPAQASGGWNVFASLAPGHEFGADLIGTSDQEEYFANFASYLPEASPPRTVTYLNRTESRLLITGHAGDQVYYIHVARRRGGLASLHFSHPKDAANSAIWRRAFLVMSEQFLVE